MTRKHYVALAKAFAANKPKNVASPEHIQWERDVRAIANVLADDNSRFDRYLFYKAVGYDA